MAPSTNQVTKRTGFLDLPDELRNNIYVRRIKWPTSFVTVKQYRIRYQVLLPLLLANSQIACEVRPLLFAENGIHLIPQEAAIHSCSRRTTWCFADLPPANIRPLIKRAKLTLYVLHTLQHINNSENDSVVDDGLVPICQDIWEPLWLEPLLRLTSLGFRLEELVIEAEYRENTDVILRKPGEDEQRFDLPRVADKTLIKQWLEKAIRGIALKNANIQLNFKRVF